MLPLTSTLCFLFLLISTAAGDVYPKKCGSSSDCDPYQRCEENYCICKPEDGLEYNEKSSSCVKLAGAQCLNETDKYKCVDKAECNLESGVCECNPGYVADATGECKRGYGKPCRSSTDWCSASAILICDKKEKFCRCKDPETMIYEPTKKACVSIIGEICELQDWMGFTQGCISNAECDGALHAVESYGRCSCKKGFRNFSHAICSKGYLDDCGTDSDCITGFCGYSNRCECARGTVYDEDLEECRAGIGQLCDEQNRPCSLNSFCDPWTRKCKCQEGYAPEGKRCLWISGPSTSNAAMESHQGKGLWTLVIICATISFLVTLLSGLGLVLLKKKNMRRHAQDAEQSAIL